MKMIYDAAAELVHTCVVGVGGRTEGGIATGIGMLDDPAAIPRTYSRTRGAGEVEC